jgi:HEAT repeat protein
MRALAGRITDPKLNVQAVRNLSAVFAYHDCSSAADLLLAAREKIEDGEARMFLQIALGWSDDPKAKGGIYAGLNDSDLCARRASFLGGEKTKDSAAIPKLMDLLSDKDPETRWNASFTLRELSGGHAMVNIYLPEDELKTSISAAREWWEKNKSTYRIGD